MPWRYLRGNSFIEKDMNSDDQSHIYSRYKSGRSFLEILRWIAQEYGIWRTPSLLFRRLSLLVFVRLTKPVTFEFQEHSYPYCNSILNKAFANERTVEVPIVVNATRSSKRVLEIGHVLSNYGHQGHDVVDKYELDRGVLNVDILDFETDVRYDCIVSISTFEHIGWDERQRDPDKVFLAIQKSRSLLSAGGMMLLTVPLGYNQALDKSIRERSIEAAEMGFLKRINRRNEWIETPLEEAVRCKYGSPYACANAVAVLRFTRPAGEADIR